MIKRFEIEDDFARGFVEKCCKTVAGEAGSIDMDLEKLRRLLGQMATEKYGCLNVGRGGSHIWVSDVWNRRVAIITYQVI